MIFSFQCKQFINSDKEKVWKFISDPYNLALITPPKMEFKIINESVTKLIYPGMIIEYHVKPLLGIKMRWLTEITHVKDEEFFVDEQRMGPYNFWHHQHILKEHNGGTEMEDIVHYKLPGGPVGRVLNYVVIKDKLDSIFAYREKMINEYFN